jgi:diguanylate cyclase (GGDEF)-like protein/PAS domain S-box-containing protein
MAKQSPALSRDSEEALRNEIARLNKVVNALMDRAERSTNTYSSYFNQFQTTVMLESLVQQRTHELEVALHENEKITRALREAEKRFYSVLDQSMVGITLLIENRFYYANPKFAEIIGYSIDEILQQHPSYFALENDQTLVNTLGGQEANHNDPQISFSAHVQRKDGQIITVEISGSRPVDINGKPALISVWQDITEKLRIEREVMALQAQLQEQAIHDPLTGLYNRLFLIDNLERELKQAERAGGALSVIMIDIDHFKAVNDRYGHLAGDEVLRHFARILKTHARSSDMACRYGGEEFFLVLPDTCLEVAGERAEQLRQTLTEQNPQFESRDIAITASFGVASFSLDGGVSTIDLIGKADAALYQAKNSGRNRVVCCNG